VLLEGTVRCDQPFRPGLCVAGGCGERLHPLFDVPKRFRLLLQFLEAPGQRVDRAGDLLGLRVGLQQQRGCLWQLRGAQGDLGEHGAERGPLFLGGRNQPKFVTETARGRQILENLLMTPRSLHYIRHSIRDEWGW